VLLETFLHPLTTKAVARNLTQAVPLQILAELFCDLFGRKWRLYFLQQIEHKERLAAALVRVGRERGTGSKSNSRLSAAVFLPLTARKGFFARYTVCNQFRFSGGLPSMKRLAFTLIPRSSPLDPLIRSSVPISKSFTR
jgi:hypothetical protein